MGEEKKESKALKIYVTCLTILVIVLTLVFGIRALILNEETGIDNTTSEKVENNKKDNGDNEDKEDKEESKKDKEEKDKDEKDEDEESDEEEEEDTSIVKKSKKELKYPLDDSSVIYAGRLYDIVNKVKDNDTNEIDDSTISLNSKTKAEISCVKYEHNKYAPDSVICSDILIKINSIEFHTYDQFTGCSDGTYVLITKNHYFTHKISGCGDGYEIIVDGKTNITKDLQTDIYSIGDDTNNKTTIRYNNNKLYYLAYDPDLLIDGDRQINYYEYDVKTGTTKILDTFYGDVSGQG